MTVAPSSLKYCPARWPPRFNAKRGRWSSASRGWQDAPDGSGAVGGAPTAGGGGYPWLVLAPDHLLPQWRREILETVPDPEVITLGSWQDSLACTPWRNAPAPAHPVCVLLRRDRAKFSYRTRFAARWSDPRGGWICAAKACIRPTWPCSEPNGRPAPTRPWGRPMDAMHAGRTPHPRRSRLDVRPPRSVTLSLDLGARRNLAFLHHDSGHRRRSWRRASRAARLTLPNLTGSPSTSSGSPTAAAPKSHSKAPFLLGIGGET